jgi:MFS family permease
LLGRDFWKLWSSASVAGLGDGIRYAAIPLLAATYTRDPLVLSAVAVAGSLPWLICSVPFGAVADRYARRKVMMVGHLGRALIAGVLTLYVLTGHGSIHVLIVIALAFAVFEVLFESAAQAALPTVVPRTHLERANARMSAAQMLFDEFSGPPVGALLFSFAILLPFVVNTSTFLIAAVLLATIPLSMGTARPDGPRTTLRQDMVEGLRWMRSAALVNVIVVLAAALTLVRAGGLAILVLFALEVLDTGTIGFGVLATTMAVGSFAGTLVAAAFVRRAGLWPVLVLFPVAIGALYVVVGLSTNAIVVGAVFAAAGVLTMVWQVAAVTTRQRLTPNRLLGRVTSVSRVFAFGAAPFGALLAGVTGRWLGLSAPFLLGGVLLVVVGVTMAVLPVTRVAFRRMPEDEAAAEAADSTT